MKTLNEILHLIERANFPQAQQLLKTREDQILNADYTLLWARLHLDQGYCEKVRPTLSFFINSSLHRNPLHISKAQLFLCLLDAIQEAKIKESRKTIFNINQQAKQEKQWDIMALSADYFARITLMGITYQILSQDNLKEALDYLQEASNYYMDSGKFYDGLKAKERLIEYGQTTVEQKIEQLRKVQQQAIELGETIMVSDSQLAILQYSSLGLIRRNKLSIPYQKLAKQYKADQNYLGLLKLKQLYAKKLFQIGKDGRAFLKEALKSCEQLDIPSESSKIWSEYGTQSLQFGDLKALKLSYQKNLNLAEITGLKVSKVVALMGLGEYQFRTSQFGEALQYYQQAEVIAKQFGLLPMVGLNLANIYDQINQREKAIQLANNTLRSIKKNNSQQHLSHAYLVLGNILVSAKEWEPALKIWQEGFAFEEKHQNWQGMAEKHSSLLWSKAQNWYQIQNFLEESQYNDLKADLYLTLDWIAKIKEQQPREQSKAQLFQLMANVAMFAKRYEEASNFLDTSAQSYEQLSLQMQAANTWAMKGLVSYGLGEGGQNSYWRIAVDAFKRSLYYFESVDAKDFTWKLKYYLANIAIALGELQANQEEKLSNWEDGNLLIHHAAKDIEFIRLNYFGNSTIETDAGKLGLVQDKSKVYQLGLRLNLSYLKNNGEALFWLEQMKSKALWDLLKERKKSKPMLKQKKIQSNLGWRNIQLLLS